MAHGQFLAPDDIARMVRLGVFGRHLAVPLVPRGHPRRPRGGARRGARGALTAQSVDHRRRRPRGAGGSDWPVSESPDPFEGMQGLVTRADPLGRAPGVLWPEQAITAGEALEVFTDQRRHRDGARIRDGIARARQVRGLRDRRSRFRGRRPGGHHPHARARDVVRRAAGLLRGLTARAQEGVRMPHPNPSSRLGQCAPASSIRNRAPCSPIRTAGAFVFPVVIRGMTEASITRSPSMPRTRSRPSTTASASHHAARAHLVVVRGDRAAHILLELVVGHIWGRVDLLRPPFVCQRGAAPRSSGTVAPRRPATPHLRRRRVPAGRSAADHRDRDRSA